MDAKLKASGRDIPGEKKYDQFDAKMKFLEKKLRIGPDLDIGVKGSNRVSSMASQYTKSVGDKLPPSAQYSKSYEDKPSFFPPVSKSVSGSPNPPPFDIIDHRWWYVSVVSPRRRPSRCIWAWACTAARCATSATSASTWWSAWVLRGSSSTVDASSASTVGQPSDSAATRTIARSSLVVRSFCFSYRYCSLQIFVLPDHPSLVYESI